VAIQTTSSELNNNYESKMMYNFMSPIAPGTPERASPLNLAVLAPNVIAMPGGTTGYWRFGRGNSVT